MTVFVLMLLLLLGQPGVAQTATPWVRHFLRRASAFVLSVRRNRVVIGDAIRVLNGAALASLGVVLCSAVSVWPDDTAAGRLAFALTVAAAVYIVIGTHGTAELLRERERWVTARRLIDPIP